MTYGEQIRQGREARGLTQEQLAESLDVSRQAVSKWEMDRSRPARGKLARLSQVLEIPETAWAAIDAAQTANGRFKDAAGPWKIAAAVLAVLCLVLGGFLAAAWRQCVRPEARVPSESAAAVPEQINGAAGLEEVFPGLLPLKERRDFDFGGQHMGEYDPACVPFLNDPLRLEEESLWSGEMEGGGRLRAVRANPRHENGATFYDLYLLYAPAGSGPPEWEILTCLAEENVYPETFAAERFANVLGYDGWKLSVVVGASAGALDFYFSRYPDGSPCLMAVGSNAREADVDEDGVKEIVSVDEIPFFCEITDAVEGEEGALVYTLDPYGGGFANVGLSFAPEKGGFVVTDSHNAVLARYILRDGAMVRVPLTDFSVLNYPDVAGTRVEFAADAEGLSDGLDPDDVLYNGSVRITHRQQAYLALQELYGLTGLRVDFCYCAANEFGVLFSLLPGGFGQRSFFTADFGEDYGGRGDPQFCIAWKELGNDWSPLSLAESALPGPEIPPETVLGWYYGRLHMFHTGEAALETGGAAPGEINLYLENGDLCVGTLRETEWGPALVGLMGPVSGGEIRH